MKPADLPAAVQHAVARLSQPDAYRFGPENLLLADLLPTGPSSKHIVDLGCGCGVLGIVAAITCGAHQLTLVDTQADMLHYAAANAPLADCPVTLVNADVRSLTLANPADLVVMNPPFFAPGAGRESSNPLAARATHAHAGDVADFLHAAARLLDPGGEAWLVYPADGLTDALNAALSAGLYPDLAALVHARHRARAFRVWIRFTFMHRAMQLVSCTTWTRR